MWAKVKDQDGIWKYQVAINLLIFNFNGALLVTHAWPVFSVSFSECCQLLVETIEPPLLFWSSLCSCTFWHRHAQAALFCFSVWATKIPHIYPMDPADSSHNRYAQKWGASPAFFSWKACRPHFFPSLFYPFHNWKHSTTQNVFLLSQARDSRADVPLWCHCVHTPLEIHELHNI